ncbi:uncharacterized protein isoform X1 [Rhodnius prolixus]|uniref:uncharacterized protein isoform X1 n=1 Tax=Rhodnius prolixus TaxID=13249 RepID=UPI003D18C71C
MTCQNATGKRCRVKGRLITKGVPEIIGAWKVLSVLWRPLDSFTGNDIHHRIVCGTRLGRETAGHNLGTCVGIQCTDHFGKISSSSLQGFRQQAKEQSKHQKCILMLSSGHCLNYSSGVIPKSYISTSEHCYMIAITYVFECTR